MWGVSTRVGAFLPDAGAVLHLFLISKIALGVVVLTTRKLIGKESIT